MLKIIIGFDEWVWFFEISLGEKRGDWSWLNNWLNLQPIGANGKKENKDWVFDLVQDVCQQGCDQVMIRQWGN